VQKFTNFYGFLHWRKVSPFITNSLHNITHAFVFLLESNQMVSLKSSNDLIKCPSLKLSFWSTWWILNQINSLLRSLSSQISSRQCWRSFLEIDRYIGQADIWVLPIYRYWPKGSILSASASVNKTLLYSSRIQIPRTRKHNEPSQDSYLAATLAGAVS